MSDRERLIELIIKEVPRPKADALAYHLLANGVIVPPKWISVKDKLPDKNGTYLCCWNGHIGAKPCISIYSFAKNLRKVDKYDFEGKNRAGWYDYDSEWGYGEMCDVTHWMPLPKLPKECEG